MASRGRSILRARLLLLLLLLGLLAVAFLRVGAAQSEADDDEDDEEMYDDSFDEYNDDDDDEFDEDEDEGKSASGICDSAYCHYGASLQDRLQNFYSVHAPEIADEKAEMLAVKYKHHERELFDSLRSKYVRELLKHRYRHMPLSRPFRRISVQELMSDADEFVPYREGRRAFVLTGAAEGWKAMKRWGNLKYLARKFPSAVADYYPYNMLQSGTHPFLYRFGAGTEELLSPRRHPEKRDHQFHPGRYLHLQLTRRMWDELKPDMNPYPKWFDVDNWWMRRCLEQKDPEQASDANSSSSNNKKKKKKRLSIDERDVLIDEYHLKTHWQIILTGTTGAGMFNHSDSLRTSSWHTHVEGRKWWIACGKNVGEGPEKGEFHCHEDVLQPGDTLYYPKDFYHMTQNIDTPTMTVTGTVVNSHNWRSIAERFYGECTTSNLSFDLSARLCDALDKCYQVWEKRFTGKTSPNGLFRPWREVAKQSEIAKREKVDPRHNNYDGRNHISE